MKRSFRLSMQWLHTWTGAVSGLILFLVFFNGTAAYFKQEITTWMEPQITAAIDPVKSVVAAQAFLTANTSDAEAWTISVPDARRPVADVSWRFRSDAQARDDDDGRLRPGRSVMIDSRGYPLAVNDTEGGNYFFQFHFAFHYLPLFVGSIIVGLASLALMVALTTGVIIHRRIFADFFTFRPANGPRSWLDAHTTFAVLALPFHMMITYTGVAILAFFFMPWAVFANYSSAQAFFSDLAPRPHAAALSGIVAPLVPITSVLQSAEAQWRGGRAATIHVTNPGDASATIEIVRRQSALLVGGRGDTLTFNGATGALVRGPSNPSAAAIASSVVFSLHEAHFANPALRWLLFLCGTTGTAMTATGSILWAERRRRKLPNPVGGPKGFRLLETLNVAIIAGYPAATAAYFWSNRLLPASIQGRSNGEILCSFACWGVFLVWSALRPKRKAWVEVLGVGSFLFLALPVANAVTTSRGTIASLIGGDALYIGFDAVCLALGLLLGASAVWTGRRLSSHAGPPVDAPDSSVSLSVPKGSE